MMSGISNNTNNYSAWVSQIQAIGKTDSTDDDFDDTLEFSQDPAALSRLIGGTGKGREPTEEEIKELSQKYDITHMTVQEHAQMLNDLVERGILSGQDYRTAIFQEVEEPEMEQELDSRPDQLIINGGYLYVPHSSNAWLASRSVFGFRGMYGPNTTINWLNEYQYRTQVTGSLHTTEGRAENWFDERMEHLFEELA